MTRREGMTLERSHDNHHVYSELKRRIVLIEYEPGQVLREKDLIEEFGVSRTPIREALIRLETEGLVRIIPSSSTMVTEVSFQNLKDVFEVRSYLIRLAGELAASRITESELASLRSDVEAMENESDPKRLMELDLAFHDQLNRATKNDVLANMLQMLRNQSVRIWAFSREMDDYYDQLAEEHAALLQSLTDRDAARSAELLEKHTKRFIEHIRQQL